MTQKEMATQFLQMAGSGDVREAYEKFIAQDFIHHNLYFKGDRESLMLAMEDSCKKSPGKTCEVKKIYEDGETVITHSLVRMKVPHPMDVTVVHVFRFQNSKVVELWDVGQSISKDSPNENGAF